MERGRPGPTRRDPQHACQIRSTCQAIHPVGIRSWQGLSLCGEAPWREIRSLSCGQTAPASAGEVRARLATARQRHQWKLSNGRPRSIPGTRCGEFCLSVASANTMIGWLCRAHGADCVLPRERPKGDIGPSCRVWSQFCRQCEQWNQTIREARCLWKRAPIMGLCNFHGVSIWLPIGNRKSKRFTFIVGTFLLPTFPFRTSVTVRSPWAMEPRSVRRCFLFSPDLKTQQPTRQFFTTAL